jgi:hypothetical protein
MFFIFLIIILIGCCLYIYTPKKKFKTTKVESSIENVNVNKGKEIYRSKTELSDFVFININEFALIDTNKIYFFRHDKLIQTITFETTFELNMLCANDDMIFVYSPHFRKVVVYKHDRNMYWYEFQSITDPNNDNSNGFGHSMNYNDNKLFISTRTNIIYTYIESFSTNQFYLRSYNQVNENISCVLNNVLYVSNYFQDIELDSKVKFCKLIQSENIILVGTQFKLYVFKKDVDILEFNQLVNRYIYDVSNLKLLILFNHSWIEVSLNDVKCVEYILDDKDMIVCSNKYCITKDDVLFDIKV